MQRWRPQGGEKGTTQPSFIYILSMALPSCPVKVCVCPLEGADRVMDDTASAKRDSTAGPLNDRGSGPAHTCPLRAGQANAQRERGGCHILQADVHQRRQLHYRDPALLSSL